MSFKVSGLTKTEIRAQARALRKTLPMDTISAQIIVHLLAWPGFADYPDVFLFYPLPGEIDLRGLTDTTRKNWYLPRVAADNQLVFHRYRPGDDLYPGAFGIMEPSPNAEIDDATGNSKRLIFVPGMVFDRMGGRLGYGKGFYDRFLKDDPKASQTLTVGVVPAALLADGPLPADPWDCPVLALVSEDGFFNVRG